MEDNNRHMGQFSIGVLPELRRNGIGSRLLAGIAEVTRDTGRRLLITDTYGAVPAGAAFMTRLGGKIGLETHVNQLDVTCVDRDLLRDWQQRARDRATGFDLGLWEGPYPEADIQDIVALKKAMNLAPRGDLEIEDFDLTAEQLRQLEKSHAARGIHRTPHARYNPPSNGLVSWGFGGDPRSGVYPAPGGHRCGPEAPPSARGAGAKPPYPRASKPSRGPLGATTSPPTTPTTTPL